MYTQKISYLAICSFDCCFKIIVKFSLLDYDYDDDEFRPHASLGANTYRKARGGMSLASGYFTPSRRSAATRRSDTIETLKLSPRSKARSMKSEYSKKASMDLSYDTSRAGSESPRKKVFCKFGVESYQEWSPFLSL